MELKSLKLYQFKNRSADVFEFHNRINAFVGNNGVGKTNILDAIYLLSTTKSYFNHLDQFLIQFNKSEMSVMAHFEGTSDVEIGVNIAENAKKRFKKNGKYYTKLVDHIGLFQVVFITPFDVEFVYGGSEIRRKFIDYTISQIDKQYLIDIISYRKILEQRNAYLKLNKGRFIDGILMESYNSKLIPVCKRIHAKRLQFCAEINVYFNQFYAQLTQDDQSLRMEYSSGLNEMDYEVQLNESFSLDCITCRTNEGIHKDDLIVLGDLEKPFKKIGSQGQVKSFIIALKLAQFEFLKQKSNQVPILLLDDIFEKIDDIRSKRLLEIVCSKDFGQIFITDTHKERIEDKLNALNVDCEYFETY